MRRLQSTFTDNSGRSVTPLFKPEDVYLFNRFNQPEGLYDVECWPQMNYIKVSFSLYHQGIFREPIVIKEASYDTYDKTMSVWNGLRGVWAIASGFDADKRFCTPVMNRDMVISRMNLEPGKKSFRQRNFKKFAIQLLFHQTACPSWHVKHYHGTMIRISDESGHVVQEEKFDCDNVMAGIERYKYVLDNFDLAYMELQL